MRDDDVSNALLERALDDREGVVTAEVSRREDQPVARDRPEHVARLRPKLTAGIGDVWRFLETTGTLIIVGFTLGLLWVITTSHGNEGFRRKVKVIVRPVRGVPHNDVLVFDYLVIHHRIYVGVGAASKS